jgi:tRNA G18 (ribose-2'-O)-methylase SpoU
MSKVQKLKLEELNRIDIETFKEADKIPLVIVVDNFRSGLNVGSIFRTSDAFLVSKVLLCGITSCPPHKEILKTAIGANHSVDWKYYQEIKTALLELKQEGFHIVGIEQTTASTSLSDFEIERGQKYAIVMGNEVEGISETALPLIETFLEIPQFGTKHSLNVSVCAGIVIHKFAQAFL